MSTRRDGDEARAQGHDDVRLQLVMRAARVASRECMLSSGCLTWSDSSAALYGHVSDGAFARHHDEWLALVHPDDAARVGALLAEAATRVARYETEFRVVLPDGTVRWLRELGETFADSGGQPVRLVAINLDVSRSHLAQAELVRAQALADEASRLKTQFLANISHEIRTPIGAVLGFCELMRDPHASETRKRDYLGRIQRNGTHLLHLVDSLLDVATIETDQLAMTQQTTAVGAFMQELRASLLPAANAKGLALRFAVDGAIPAQIYTDPKRWRQILSNVIGNAIKFTDAGVITVTLSYRPTPGPLAQGRLQARVRDSGMGINAAKLEQLFQPFMQADCSSSRRHGGVGLGLALARRLARLLGGDVELLDTSSWGSTFLVSVETGRQVQVSQLYGADEVAGDAEMLGASALSHSRAGPADEPQRFKARHSVDVTELAARGASH